MAWIKPPVKRREKRNLSLIPFYLVQGGTPEAIRLKQHPFHLYQETNDWWPNPIFWAHTGDIHFTFKPQSPAASGRVPWFPPWTTLLFRFVFTTIYSNWSPSAKCSTCRQITTRASDQRPLWPSHQNSVHDDWDRFPIAHCSRFLHDSELQSKPPPV